MSFVSSVKSKLNKSILDDTSVAFYLKDEDGKYEVVNSAFEICFNIDSSQIIGKTDHEVFPKEVADAIVEEDQKTKSEGRSLETEEVFIINKQEKTFLAFRTPIFNGNPGLYGTYLNITHHKQKQKQILKNYHSHRVLNSLLELPQESTALKRQLETGLDILFSHPSLELNGRGSIFLIDEEARCLKLKASRDATLGTGLQTGCSEVQFGECICGNMINITSPTFFSCKYGEHSKEGVRGPHSHFFIPLISRGKQMGLINLYTESEHDPSEHDDFFRTVGRAFSGIIERRLIEEELIQKSQEAERANRAKSDFLSRISHELRTPLNGILGFAQLLETTKTTPTQKDYLDEILNSGKHLLSLIDDILDISRIEAGKVNLNIENADVYRIAQKSATTLRPLARKDKIKIKVDTNLKKNMVHADPLRLKQAILNFISNAVKYNKKRGEVRIHCSKEGNHLKIMVTDTGIGIPETLQDRLFQPFDRLGVEDLKIKGTGIGLLITKKIIEVMDGTVGVESKEGEGSTFWLRLPLSDKVVVRRRKLATKDGVIKGIDVLYIEDNPVNIKLMERLIPKVTGRKITVAIDAESGLEKLKKDANPNVIFLDISLPGMSGYDLKKKLDEDPKLSSIPVIACSAHVMSEHIEKAKKQGFFDYLVKPISIDKLREKLTRVAVYISNTEEHNS